MVGANIKKKNMSKSLNKEVSTSVQIHPPKSEAQNKSSKHRFFTFADVSESMNEHSMLHIRKSLFKPW